MTNTIPDEVDGVGFEAKLEACSDSLREMVSYLRASSQHAGVAVIPRRFRHPDPNSGWGVSYYTGTDPFCEIHPKVQEGHAWVRLRGVDAGAVEAAGFKPSKQPGWFKIRAMGEAVRIVHWIVQAHDARASSAA
jgi:hypothetical protein